MNDLYFIMGYIYFLQLGFTFAKYADGEIKTKKELFFHIVPFLPVIRFLLLLN